jgi:hypothetical protein
MEKYMINAQIGYYPKMSLQRLGHCMQILVNIAEKLPELKREIRLVIEELTITKSAAIRSRSRHLIKRSSLFLNLIQNDILIIFSWIIYRMMLYLALKWKTKTSITSFLMVTPFFTKGEYHSPFRPVRGNSFHAEYVFALSKAYLYSLFSNLYNHFIKWINGFYHSLR